TLSLPAPEEDRKPAGGRTLHLNDARGFGLRAYDTPCRSDRRSRRDSRRASRQKGSQSKDAESCGTAQATAFAERQSGIESVRQESRNSQLTEADPGLATDRGPSGCEGSRAQIDCSTASIAWISGAAFRSSRKSMDRHVFPVASPQMTISWLAAAANARSSRISDSPAPEQTRLKMMDS